MPVGLNVAIGGGARGGVGKSNPSGREEGAGGGLPFRGFFAGAASLPGAAAVSPKVGWAQQTPHHPGGGGMKQKEYELRDWVYHFPFQK